MVHAAAHAHGVFFERAEQRRRFSCVAEFRSRPRELLDEAVREGGDPAKPL